MFTTRYAGLTDVGSARAENEDRWFADPQEGLYLVADGMGGECAGALASKAVVEVLPRLLRQRLQGFEMLDDPAVSLLVGNALAEISASLRNESCNRPGLNGMGSTVVLALFRGRHMLVAHLGDSRAYLLHEGIFRQLTKDHSMVQLLIDCGEIAPEDVASHPARGQLTRYVGAPSKSLAEIRVEPIVVGDRVLLCSDGLSSMLPCEQMAEILKEQSFPHESCKQLLDAASLAGCKDNITAVVIAIG